MIAALMMGLIVLLWVFRPSSDLEKRDSFPVWLIAAAVFLAFTASYMILVVGRG